MCQQTIQTPCMWFWFWRLKASQVNTVKTASSIFLNYVNKRQKANNDKRYSSAFLDA